MKGRRELNFKEMEKEPVRFLSLRKNRHMALATSADGIVQARIVLVANKGLNMSRARE